MEVTWPEAAFGATVIICLTVYMVVCITTSNRGN